MKEAFPGPDIRDDTTLAGSSCRAEKRAGTDRGTLVGFLKQTLSTNWRAWLCFGSG
jgi:hypothetical protein